MPPMNKDLFFMIGASVAFIAAILTIIDRILSLRERWRARPPSSPPPEKLKKPLSTEPETLESLIPKNSWSRFSPLSYLFYRELLIIGGAGILLNYLGLALSVRLESILFLDMTGTALVAFLLGPWWGAVVALLSSSTVNWLLYPGPEADYLIFPWSLVNMTGAIFWGSIARTSGFERYLASGHTSMTAHLWFLIRLGVFGGVIMSIPGTIVQAAIADQSKIVLHTTVIATLENVVHGWQQEVQGYLTPALGLAWADSLGWGVVHWVQNCLRYIPDKTVTVAIALVVLKYGFPLFERELIHGGPTAQRPKESWFAPLILGLLYIPSFITLISGKAFSAGEFWPLWTAPWAIILGGCAVLFSRKHSIEEIRTARLNRGERYFEALKPIEQEPSYQFCRRLGLGTLIASAMVAVCLPLLMSNYVHVAFHFFCVVYGFLLAMHLVHVSISQNMSIARTGGFATIELTLPEKKSEKARAKKAPTR